MDLLSFEIILILFYFTIMLMLSNYLFYNGDYVGDYINLNFKVIMIFMKEGCWLLSKLKYYYFMLGNKFLMHF